jgi:signal transduction histidine kinase
MAGRLAVWRNARPGGFPVPDVALAALLFVIAVASAATGRPDEGPLAITVPAAVAMTAPLAWRRKIPLLPALAGAAANLFQGWLAETPGSLWSLVVFAVAMYSVAAWSSEGFAAVGGAVLLAALLGGEWLARGPDYLFIVLVFGGIWLLGRAGRLWRSRLTFQQLHERDAARLAVAEERLRIARELHDVLGHSMSVIAVQADAAGAALDSVPDLARGPLRVIHSTARGSLAEIRAMLDVLRGEDGGAAPGLSQLGPLLDGSALAGLPVTQRISADLPTLEPAADLALYRVVQESLTNVLKHAGMIPTSVSVQRVGGGVEAEIRNAPGNVRAGGPGSGYGLQGLRERMQLAGGTLDAGPLDDGGWRVCARIPGPGSPPRGAVGGEGR